MVIIKKLLRPVFLPLWVPDSLKRKQVTDYRPDFVQDL